MIKLTDKYFISADSNQYILGTPTKTTDKKSGNVSTFMKNPSYYTTVSGAVKGAVSRLLRDGVSENEITTLREFLDESKKLQITFENLINSLDA